jgi:hypothetical protein
MRTNWLVMIAISICGLILTACAAPKNPTLTAQVQGRQIDEILAEQRKIIDQEWSKVLSARQQCEASCQHKECACLSTLKNQEQTVIQMMVILVDMQNRKDGNTRKFTLYYGWNPDDSVCRNDLKDLLSALHNSSYVKNSSLGLGLVNYGKDDKLSANIAVLLQELYSEKKIVDVLQYLQSVQFRYFLTTEMQLIPAGTGAGLPYFVLAQKSTTEANARDIVFRASVYDPVAFKDFQDSKYPWSGRSIDALIMVTGSN